MADGADLVLDTGKLQEDGDRMVRSYLSAGTLAVGGATRGLEKRLEEATRVAVPGRLWRAWASGIYPRKGIARDPVGTVFVNGGSRSRGAIAFWTQPGSIRGRQGQLLAVPLPTAGKATYVRGEEFVLTPAKWEAAHPGVTLRPVFRPGRVPLLVADDAVLRGRGQLARRNTDKRIAAGRGSATIPIFVLLPTAKFRNAVSVDSFVRQAGADLVADFLARTRA